MTKKSLFFGGLALLALVVFAGCSNPSSSDPESSPVAGNPDIPRDAVLAEGFDQLVGLLNDTNADTNGVENIAYAGAFSAEVTIRGGKTVYWYGDDSTLAANLIVEEGARLVILGGSTLSTDGAKKQLLVKGKVDVYGGLTIGANALDVADYFEANGTKEARGTVIGTSRVAIGAGGKLTLKADDIANTNTENRFTPPQAWAAAGKGDLEVDGELSSTYTVTYMLKDISLAAGRWYTFETAGGDLPSLIPAGADVTTNAALAGTADNTLTIYGRLTAPNATLGSITDLTISGLDTDTTAAKSAAPTLQGWNEGYLEADVATLASAVSVNILDRGEFVSASKAINPPAESKINLGRSAIFTASGDSVNTFEKLSGLYAGPGAAVSIASTALTFAGLKTLTLQDGAKLEADEGTAVTFLVDPNAKTAISLGANTLYKVGVSPAAKVDVAITNNASLNAGSVLKVNEGSTFTLDAGKTFTVQPGATFDLSSLGITVPTAAPVQINGTVVFKGTVENAGTLIGANPTLFEGDPTVISKFAAFGPDGKFEFNYGSAYIFAESEADAGDEITYIGKAGDGAAFALGSNSRISISGSGISIGATNKGGFTVVAVEEDGAYIAKDQTLTLDINAELQLGVGEGVMFAGDANGGARLEGPGKIVVLDGEDRNVTITAGSGSWRAHGAGSIAIVNPGSEATVITTFETGDASFKALGASAVITVAEDTELTIAAVTTIDLSEGGTLSIAANGDDDGTKIALPAATSIIKTNAAAGTAVTQDSKKLSINGVELTIGSSTVINAASADTGGLLSSIVGVDSNGAITVKAPVSINNTAVVTVADAS
jgi:hypothetical protein